MEGSTRGTIHTVLFDMDGLLLDTEEVYTRITQELVEPYGKTFTWAVKSKMMGKTAPEAALILIQVLAVHAAMLISSHVLLQSPPRICVHLSSSSPSSSPSSPSPSP
jgi:hypothetical protein